MVSERFRKGLRNRSKTASKTDRNRWFRGLDFPCQIPIAGDVAGTHQLTPILREEGPGAVRFGVLVDEPEGGAFPLPILDSRRRRSLKASGIAARQNVRERVEELHGQGRNAPL